MKLIFDIDEKKLPEPFKLDADPAGAGLQNIIQFLHDALVCYPLEKKVNNMSDAPAATSQEVIEAAAQHDQWDIDLGRLLMESLKVEPPPSKLRDSKEF